MKNRSYQRILVIVTLVLLISLIIIQINWIYRAAQLEEERFTYRVSQALDQISTDISEDRNMCLNMRSCYRPDSAESCKGEVNIDVLNLKIDSIIKSNLDYFNISISYNYEIEYLNDSLEACPVGKKSYSHKFENILNLEKLRLNVNFPKKNQFVIAQIGPVFIVSILFIVFISVSFFITLKYYLKEKSLANSTKDFIDNMTHELKTPLTNISFANKMIINNLTEESRKKANRYNTVISDESKKMQSQIDELLQLSVLSNDNNNNGFATINLFDLIEKNRKSFDIIAKEKGGSVRYILNAEMNHIKGSETYLANIISNLIDNSVKYCTKIPDIEISTYNKTGNIVLNIKDNGIGINRQNINKVFDKYYRVPTDDKHDVKGYGIGLTYVKLMVEKMEGRIKITSSASGGTRVSIMFPVESL